MKFTAIFFDRPTPDEERHYGCGPITRYHEIEARSMTAAKAEQRRLAKNYGWRAMDVYAEPFAEYRKRRMIDREETMRNSQLRGGLTFAPIELAGI